MASTRVLLLSILLGFLAIAANARPGRFHPCKTLILFSSSSYSQFRNPNPNLSIQDPSSSSGGPFVTIFFTEVREIRPRPVMPSLDTIVVDRANIDTEKRPTPFEFYSSVGSVRDRTRDVLSAVGALLFGMGCGALTAATMYLVWSLFAANRSEFSDSDGEFDEEDDHVGPKKMGYAAIPAKDVWVPPPAKEVV